MTGGTTYYYKVAAVNSAGTSAQSTEVSGTPTNPDIYNEQGTVSGGNLVLSFNYSGTYSYFHAFMDTDQNAATGYTISGIGADYLAENATMWKSTANGSAWDWSELTGDGGETYTNASNLATFTIPLASIGSPAHLNVAFQVENSAGTPVYTTGSFTYAGGTGTAPATPTGLAATPGNTQVALSWAASTGATSYNVYRGTSSGGEGTTPVASGITGTTYTNTGLTNGTAYYFKVAAVDSVGTSSLSSEVSATPANVPPPTPTGLTATAGAGQVALAWSTSSGATSYNVYRGTSSGGESSTPFRTGLTSTGYTDLGVTSGAAYYYKVAAVGSGGTSALSSEASATPTASTATIYNEQESTSGSNLIVSFNYTGSFTYYHAFLDSDMNAATGYSIGGIGADYLAENATFWKSTASGTTWSWSEVSGDGGITFSNSSGVASWTIPLSDIGSPAHLDIVYDVEDSTGAVDATSPEVYL